MSYTADRTIDSLYPSAPLERAVRRMTEGTNHLLRKEVVRRTPIARPPAGVGQTTFAAGRGRVPGTAKTSWQESAVTEVPGSAGAPRWTAETWSDDPIMKFIEWDTRPHIIRPRPDRAAASVIETKKPRRMGDDPMARLRFVTAGGRVVYAAEVHHPGTQGQHMMRDSLMEVDATWVDKVGIPEMERWAREQAEV